jgi:penicillin amidase
MTDSLGSTAETESQQWVWRRRLPAAWQAFLFTTNHPWNEPLFGGGGHVGPVLPGPSEALPQTPIDETSAAVRYVDDFKVGSNNWAWRGRTGAFLANDPHLGYSVPSIFMAQRLRVGPRDWAVGVAIPGLPGIVIGRNAAVAWAFTNTGEDIDDYVEETLSADGQRYVLHTDAAGDPEWRPIERRTFQIRVKGEKEPRAVEGLFTERGPMAQRKLLGDAWYSREWLPLKDGVLRLPPIGFIQAHDWDSFNAAVDRMTIPAQNILYMDATGAMGYRVSGTGIRRLATGRIPQTVASGAWQGFEPSSERRRLFIPASAGEHRQIATANGRIWIDAYDHNWSGDDRKARIADVLAARDDMTIDDQTALQLDTHARFRKILLDWLGRAGAAVAADAQNPRFAAWAAWDSTSQGDPIAFEEAGFAEDELTQLLLGRVRARFLTDADKDVAYRWAFRRAWLLAVLQAPDDRGFAVFGLRGPDVARLLLKKLAAHGPFTPHQDANRSLAQHPFVGNVPVLGSLLRVDEPPQWGASDVVMAQTQHGGPAMRMVWDMKHPLESRWSLPVGESGHVRSPHYSDLQTRWAKGESMKVFDDGSTWEFVGMQ